MNEQEDRKRTKYNNLEVEEVCIARESFEPRCPKESTVCNCEQNACDKKVESFDIVPHKGDGHQQEEEDII